MNVSQVWTPRDSGKLSERAHKGGRVDFRLGRGIDIDRATNRLDFLEPDATGDEKSPYRDIVKSIEIVNLTTNYPHPFVLQFDTIPPMGNEGFFRNTTKCVTCSFGMNELSPTKPRNVTVVERSVTNYAIEFQNEHPGARPDSFHKDITWNEKKGFALIPANSPLFYYLNTALQSANPPQKPFTEVKKGLEEHQLIEVPIKLAKEYVEVTKREMQQRISYGAVGHDFSMSMNAPVPHHRAKEHERFEQTKGKEGKQFRGLADFLYAAPSFATPLGAQNPALKAEQEKFMDTQFRLDCKLRIRYLRQDERHIPIPV